VKRVLIFVALAIAALMFGSEVCGFAGQTANNLGLENIGQRVAADIGRGLVGLSVLAFGTVAMVTLVRTVR